MRWKSSVKISQMSRQKGLAPCLWLQAGCSVASPQSAFDREHLLRPQDEEILEKIKKYMETTKAMGGFQTPTPPGTFWRSAYCGGSKATSPEASTSYSASSPSNPPVGLISEMHAMATAPKVVEKAVPPKELPPQSSDLPHLPPITQRLSREDLNGKGSSPLDNRLPQTSEY